MVRHGGRNSSGISLRTSVIYCCATKIYILSHFVTSSIYMVLFPPKTVIVIFMTATEVLLQGMGKYVSAAPASKREIKEVFSGNVSILKESFICLKGLQNCLL